MRTALLTCTFACFALGTSPAFAAEPATTPPATAPETDPPLIDDMTIQDPAKWQGRMDVSVVTGWGFSQFDGGSGQHPIAGLVAYHHFPYIDYFANLTFTATEYADQDKTTLIDVLRTSNSLHFGGGIFVPFLPTPPEIETGPRDSKTKVIPTAKWNLGLIAKGGEFMRVEDKANGQNAQAWLAVGLRTCLGPKCFLDVCWGRNEDLLGQRLVLAAQVPIMWMNKEDRIRLYFRAEANIACQTPKVGQIHDDVFRSSLALEIPIGVLQSLKLPIIGGPASK